jgi:hypothetical protein
MQRRLLLMRGMGCLAALKWEFFAAAAPSRRNAVYPLPETELKTLEMICAPLLAMDEAALLQRVPPQAGFWFSECPNCNQGAQEHQLIWTPELGDKVQCQFCKQIYPNAQYPENGSIEIRKPSGNKQVWRFHEDNKGQRYWYEARRWYEQKEFLERTAFSLAQLGSRTGNEKASHRASLLLKRFAQVYPDYIVHYDFPHRPKQFFEDAVPADFEPYRAAKWSWWAYADISILLLRTHDLLLGTSWLTAADATEIETRLFRPMIEFVARYDGWRLTNMHPTTWKALAVASRVLNDNALMAKTIAQMSRLIDEQFFADGMYKEGTASYHEMTVVGLRLVLASLYPELDRVGLEERIAQQYPDLHRALTAAQRLRLPDGRFAPQRDTWSTQKSEAGPLPESKPVLLSGLGYGILGAGAGQEQFQAHLGMTGRFGHDHFDSLNLLIYSFGKELASDVGYTHSRARSWTMSTACHNTVVIDQLSQSTGNVPDRCQGRLLLFDGTDPDFQIVSGEAPTAYPDLVTTYKRSLIAVTAGRTRYIVDIFDVAGGARHDWILHGSADEEQIVDVTASRKPLVLTSVPSLLPKGHSFVEPKNEEDRTFATDGAWAYGVFRNAQTGASDDTITAIFRGKKDPSVGLQTILLGASGTHVSTASAWAVRNIGKPTEEDDGKLDQRLRQAVLVQRSGPRNRFVAVHCPFQGEVGLKRVTQFPLEPGGVLLKIERANGDTDYLLFGENASPRTGNDGDLHFTFDGQVGLITTKRQARTLKMVNGTRLTCGDETLTGSVIPSAKLLAVAGQEITVEGSLPVKPGQVAIVRHGDRATTSFNIASVRHVGGNTLLTTEEAPTLTGRPEGPLTLRSFPKTTHPGPHEVHVATRTTQNSITKDNGS